MSTAQIIQERVRFGTGDRLAGILSYPVEIAPKRAVLLCSPHPNFAGDMHNNVIAALAERMSVDSVVMQFDYRGIGDSQIELGEGTTMFDYWDAVEEARDYTDALADASDAASALIKLAGGLPPFIAGYSFGAIIAPRLSLTDPRFLAVAGIAPPLTRISFDFLARLSIRCLLISGDSDFVYDPVVAAEIVRTAGPNLIYDLKPGADHFYREEEKPLADQVAAFFDDGGA